MKKPHLNIKLSEPLQPHIFLIMLLAGVISAIGVTMFLAPVHLYDSAISGTSMLLWQLTPPQFTFSLFLVVLNVPLFLFGLRKQGAVFTIYSVWAVIVFSVASHIFEDVLPIDVSAGSPFAGDDVLLCALFGGLICGIGSGLTVRFGGAIDGIEVLAVIFAKRMGLPVGRLICASNRNDVLTEFLSTGVYDKRRTFYKTTSPSMDILVSSNLERLLSLLTDDDAYVASLMADLNERGHYKVSEALLTKLQAEFSCGCCDDRAAAETISKVWTEEKYLCDPHTAVAFHVAEQFGKTCGDGAPVVVLSTASPYKFPAAVLSALGREVQEDEFSVMEDLHACTGIPVPRNLAALREKTVRHKDVIAREDMLSYVLEKAGETQW